MSANLRKSAGFYFIQSFIMKMEFLFHIYYLKISINKMKNIIHHIEADVSVSPCQYSLYVLILFLSFV
ncbi:hypothetical protein Xsto_02885 [Xenorhabdus stockiae]|uniref:Uncharacterized protein n=1 Tax=Xenorhabdus stockiae TaxID=351614 RepID=A0A2D0KMF9_9GAMM|nr:hypothetical protein Xsto_02885 [Xenorhabdus stockiae]